MNNTNIPYANTGSYVSPTNSSDYVTFETHKSVYFMDIYLYWGYDDNSELNKTVIQSISISSDKGTAQYIDASTDRQDYIVLGQTVYSFELIDGMLKLTNI